VTFQESGEIVKLWQNPTRFTQIEKSIYVFGDFGTRSEEHRKYIHNFCTIEDKILKPESIDMVIFNV
jgi:hypothetical protein